MTDIPAWSAAFAVGMLLGAGYFGTLWLLASRAAGNPRAARWVLASLPLRLAGAAAGFYLVVAIGGAPHLVAALVGFIAVRQVAVGRARRGLRGAK